MVNYVSENYGTVHLTDGEQLDVVGMGDVNLKLSNGSFWKLTNVRYVPKLGNSLISVSQLDGDGYRTTFEDGNCKVVRGAMVIAKGQKSGTLYLTDGSQKRLKRGSGCREKQLRFDMGVSTKIESIVVGEMRMH
ncbi:hypothetical protein LIER_19541 [Lithospermum erythrorhizon]|uniref:Retrovirus-related Pol polyprotein from transposon TNT 1-94-like beta-barrel domain-containing protein n=1 Tax=Lithospermum erythrorhizon TaxID=34254 RepID=A0AAV3QJ77_LITER